VPATNAPDANWRRRYPAAARFLKSKTAIVGLVVIVILTLAALFGPSIWKYQYFEGLGREFIGSPVAPSWDHPAGTDYQGRDQFARLLIGARISLAVGVMSCLLNIIIGVGVGVIAGWTGGKLDTFLMRSVDILYSVPLLLVVILLQVFVKPILVGILGDGVDVPLIISPDLVSIYIALGLTNWLMMARLARSEVMSQVARDYVLAARSLGVKPSVILLRHVLPNCLGPIAVAATLAIPEAIFIESFLAFVGLGVSAPAASLGSLASDGLSGIRNYPWLLTGPAIAISVTMLAFNLFGDGLQTRDFCFVANAVEANILAATTPRPLQGDVLNVAGGRRVALRELAEMLVARTGRHTPIHTGPPRAGDVRDSLADVSRARDLLGYVPEVRWEDGLAPTIAFLTKLHETKEPP